MRILLLPLTRRRTLLYAQRLTQNAAHKPNPWLVWASQKAQQTWIEWGKSDTSWKAKTVATGNRLLDKIDWEEYSLKTVHDPKSTNTETVPAYPWVSRDVVGVGGGWIPVVSPSWVKEEETGEILREIVKRRKPIHQTYRWRWAVAIPLSAPFSLVPVLPNLPFFYAAYRLWSHHKALKGAEYLEQLLEQNALKSESSPILDKIYALEKPPTLTREDVPLGPSTQELLLNKDQLTEISKEFNDNEILVLGKRALTQLTKQLDGEIVKREDKARRQQEADVASSEEESIKVKEKSSEELRK